MAMNDDESRTVFSYIKKCMPRYTEFSPETIAEFYDEIASKHEFISLEEDELATSGMYNHQILINRLLNPATGTLNQLVFYEMGLGKSFIYLSLINEWRAAMVDMYRPLILVRNMKLVSTIRNEIRKFSTLVLKSDEFPHDASTKYINSVIRAKYEIQTYYKFATYLSTLSAVEYKQCIADHSNTVVVFDEIQHLKNMENLAIYDIIYKFIKSVDNTRIYEFSGTPMVDSAYEFENIINLIIPEPIKIQFDAQSRLININSIKKRVAGYISYLKFKPSDLTLKTYGKINVNNSGYYVDATEMSKFQSYHFYRALYADSVKDGLHINYKLPYTTEQYLRDLTLNCWIRCDRCDKLNPSIRQLNGWLKTVTNSNVKLNIHTGAYPKKQQFDILWFVDEIPTNISQIDGYIIPSGMHKYIVLSASDGRFITDVKLNTEIEKVVRPIRSHVFFMYETEMDRFIKSMEADLEVAENIDMPLAQDEPIMGKQGTAYLNANQASLFIYPDGSYGRNGEKRYLKQSYNAQNIDEWIDISKRFPCDIYTKILTSIKNDTKIIIQMVRIDPNIIFLLKVLNSLKYKKTATAGDAAKNPLNRYYTMTTFNDQTDFTEYSDRLRAIQRMSNIYIIFMTCSKSNFNDISEMVDLRPYSIFRDMEQYHRCSPRNEFDDYFTVSTIDSFMHKVKNLSAKYHSVLKHLVESASHITGDNIPIKVWKPIHKLYIYSELIHGSGVIVLMKMLDMLGYTNIADELHKVDESSDPFNYIKPKPRYAFISSHISDAMMDRIINVYNSKRNISGQYIQLFMGTETVSEGITLYDTPVMFSITRTWNIASSDQAERRIYRLNAFISLKKKLNTNNIEVDMKRLISIPLKLHKPSEHDDINVIDSWLDNNTYDDTKSLDMYTCHTALNKDKQIKAVEYMCKTTSLDCSCNYARNILDSRYDNTRECEYRKCKYTCDFITQSESSIDYSTYNAFYSHEEKQELKDYIVSMFSKKSWYTYSELMRDETIYGHVTMDDTVVFAVLYDIINDRVPILSPLGFKQVLYYDMGIFYLSNADIPRNFLNYTYCDNTIKSEFPKMKRTMEDIYNDYIDKSVSEKININLVHQYVSNNRIEDVVKLMGSPEFDASMALELIKSALIVPNNQVTSLVFDKYSKYIYSTKNAHLVRLAAAYYIYYKNEWGELRTRYESVDDAMKLEIVSILTEYFSKKLNISKRFIQSRNIPEDKRYGILYIYGTFRYTDVDKFTFSVYNGKSDMETKLNKNILDYLGRKKAKDIIPGGVNIVSLNKDVKDMIRALCGIPEKGEFRTKCMECLQHHGLMIL